MLDPVNLMTFGRAACSRALFSMLITLVGLNLLDLRRDTSLLPWPVIVVANFLRCTFITIYNIKSMILIPRIRVDFKPARRLSCALP
jgi:hypothetical protein